MGTHGGRVCYESRVDDDGRKIILSAVRAKRAAEARTRALVGRWVSAGGEWVTYISSGLIFAYRRLARPPPRRRARQPRTPRLATAARGEGGGSRLFFIYGRLTNNAILYRYYCDG